MRFTYLLPLAAFSSALVLPDEQVFSELSVQSRHKAESVLDQLHSAKDKAINYLSGSFRHEDLKTVGQLFDDAVAGSGDDNDFLVSSLDDQSIAAQAFLNYASEEDFEIAAEDDGEHPHPPPPPPHHGPPKDEPPHHGPPRDEPPHHGPPRDGPPHHGPPRDGPPHHGPPRDGPPHHGPSRGKPPHHGPPGHGKRPHHPPHHKPNETIYQLISKSKYTTKLAALISEYDDIVKLLNSTKANYTIFAPTDYAFSKIPDKAPKPPKEFIEKLLTYHVAPGLFPAGRVLFDKTVPTLVEEASLGGPQRIAARVGLKGVTLNFYSRIVAVNIPATNGIIHGIDSILIPPPPALKIIEHLPTEFSTLLYALEKTGLINSTSTSSECKIVGSTLFAPTNGAFRKLGPRINAFLFSPAGTKYLKALLLYHVVLNQTVYSTAYYNGTEKSTSTFSSDLKRRGCHHKNAEVEAYPYVHFDLPTLLHGRSLAVDIGRYGPFVEIKINAFNRVVVADGVAKDGVIHLPERVLIPPKQLSGPTALSYWTGEEMTVEDFKGRFEPFLENQESFTGLNLEL